MGRSHDIAIIGAGPVGSLGALAHARRGARVLLLEANPRAATRFAGEWIHPPGVAALDRLQLGRLDSAAPRTGYGFKVFPEDGTEAIELPYPSGQVALSCAHHEIVRVLREQAIDHSLVEYRPHTRVREVDGHTLHVQARGQSHAEQIAADRIVGADGRSSLLREHLGGPQTTLLSYMASVELTGVELPFEGYGHVILGGPGPVLMYRIEDDRVRVCLDVPLSLGPAARRVSALWAGFGPVMPVSLRERFRRALEEGPLGWAATRFQPRRLYGHDTYALIGDAAGHLHPLTAAGLTQGFRDAEALASEASIAAFEQRRERESYVPELLGNALYQVFSRGDPSASAIRQAVYEVWRRSDAERRRTMRLLMVDEPRGVEFGSAFVHMASAALAGTLRVHVRQGELTQIPHALDAYREWAQWPLASLVPSTLRARYRGGSRLQHPIPALSRVFASKRGAYRVPPPPETRAAPRTDAVSALRPRPFEALDASATPASTDASVTPPPLQGRGGRAKPAVRGGPPAAPERPQQPYAEDWAYCREALAQVSRTFSRPIAMLPDPLERAVTCGYLLCRVADTIEDHAGLDIDRKDQLFDQFLRLLDGRLDAQVVADAFREVPGDAPDLELARTLPRVMRVYRALERPAQATCSQWVAEMARGMALYAHRPAGEDGLHALYTLDDLERYCYFVAGTVGHLLTELFVQRLGPSLSEEDARVLRRHAEAFGVGLQLVNILKDVTDDRERGWSFIPRHLCAEEGMQLRELLDPAKRRQAHAAVAPIFDRATRSLDRALEYALAIPSTEHGIRLFCLLPLWMAVRTLAVARGNDAMFEPHAPVKISRDEVESLITECVRDCGRDTALRDRYAALWTPPQPRRSAVLRTA